MSEEHEKNYLDNGEGFRSWFFTVDHKRIGVMYLWAIGVFFIIAAIASFLLRAEHLTPGQTIVSADTYNVLFTLHGSMMVFLFIVPGVAASFGNFLIPLMIGAKDVFYFLNENIPSTLSHQSLKLCSCLQSMMKKLKYLNLVW